MLAERPDSRGSGSRRQGRQQQGRNTGLRCEQIPHCHGSAILRTQSNALVKFGNRLSRVATPRSLCEKTRTLPCPPLFLCATRIGCVRIWHI